MADPPKVVAESVVEAVYAEAAVRARREVAAAFDLGEVPVNVLPATAQRRHRAVWRIGLEDRSLPVPHLLVAVPWTFPDELPDVYLPENVTHQGMRIPHLDEHRQLCTFDDAAAWPNVERAGEAVIAVIQRAELLLRDGVSGANVGDYADEFEAYWLDGALKPETAFSIVRPDGPHRRVVSVRLSTPVGLHTRIFAEDESAALGFLDGIGRKPTKPDPQPLLYLHLDELRIPNLATNADVYRLVSADEAAREALLDFLGDATRPSTVLFSIPVRSERVLGAWVHPRFGTDVYRGKRSHRKMDQAPGFRPGHLPPEVELTRSFASLRVDRVIVHRADDQRLNSRTAGAVQERMGAVNIIGCGSLGGFMADTVRYARPSLLRLVDPEHLEVHNVPRHYCDLTAVGRNKAEAVGATLRRFDPALQVLAVESDVLEVLRSAPAKLEPAIYTFVAVANVPVERRLNAVSRRLQVGTVVYVWVEPHAVAGHAVVVPASAQGCFECLLDSNFRLGIRVLANADQFERADAGCRGAYLPYSGADAQTFARTITRAALECADNASRVFTWIGDIDRARREGWEIHPDWTSAEPFTLHKRPITIRPDCPVCAPAE